MNIKTQGISFFQQNNGLKSTQERMERQAKRDNQVAFFEKQKENLKNMKADTLDDISRKLELLHGYNDQIEAAKQEYNNSQMFHAMDEARERGLYEKYKAEFDYKFTENYFITTLFSLVQSKNLRGERKTIIEELKNGLNKYVPDFRNNEYYRSRMGDEEKKLINMAMASTARFMLYYDALHLYRRVRYGR